MIDDERGAVAIERAIERAMTSYLDDYPRTAETAIVTGTIQAVNDWLDKHHDDVLRILGEALASRLQ